MTTPRPGISDREREAGMRWIVWDGILSSTMGALTSGVFLTGFALLLGATDTIIGLLSGLPRLSALMQPLGSYFVERHQIRKKISVWVFGPARMLWLFVLALPLLGYQRGASPTALIVLSLVSVLSALMAGFAAVSWFAWMADLIPARIRGRYFARRTLWAGTVSAIVAFVAGKFVDVWKVHYGKDSPGSFLIVFAIALTCGLVSWYTLIRCPEPPIRGSDEEGERLHFFSAVREAWSDSNFRNFVTFSALVTSGVWIASPFVSVYMIKVMDLPYWLMGLFGAVSSAGSLFMVRLWGKLNDHFGSRPVMSACLTGVSLMPVFWALTANGAWWPFLLANAIGGASWSGYSLAEMNMVFKITPQKRKSVYIAIYYALGGLPSLIMPVVAGYILQHTEHLALHVGNFTFVNYHFIFLASSTTRWLGSRRFRKVEEPKAKSVRHMIRVLSHVRSVNPFLGLEYSYRVVSVAAGRTTTRTARRAARALRRTAARLRGQKPPPEPPSEPGPPA